jgi:ABC-type multidrug transport system permease subunit
LGGDGRISSQNFSLPARFVSGLCFSLVFLTCYGWRQSGPAIFFLSGFILLGLFEALMSASFFAQISGINSPPRTQAAAQRKPRRLAQKSPSAAYL